MLKQYLKAAFESGCSTLSVANGYTFLKNRWQLFYSDHPKVQLLPIFMIKYKFLQVCDNNHPAVCLYWKCVLQRNNARRLPFLSSLYNAEHHILCSSVPKTSVSDILVLLKSKAKFLLTSLGQSLSSSNHVTKSHRNVPSSEPPDRDSKLWRKGNKWGILSKSSTEVSVFVIGGTTESLEGRTSAAYFGKIWAHSY